MSVHYQINKGINRSIVFKGFKAQYIIYVAVGLVILLFLFAILYLFGVGMYTCLFIIFPLGIAMFIFVQHLSKKFGEHGLVKHSANKRLPHLVITTSRKTFLKLNPDNDAKDQRGKDTTGLEN